MTPLNQRSMIPRDGFFAPPSGRHAGADGEVPNGRGFIWLLEAFRATGGTAPGEIVGRLLQEHQVGDAVSLDRLMDSGRAFGFEWRANLWIPMFQFDADDLSLKPGARQVRAALPLLGSGWAVASWFAAPNACLDGGRPVDMLGRDLGAVLQAARSLESAGEFALPLARHAHQVAVHM